MRVSVPDRVGPYRIVELLGRGGFAVVYGAETEDAGGRMVHVALKIPNAAGAVSSGFLRREASLAARLRHPGIVRVLGSGVADLGEGPLPYIAFERIDGPTLETIADQLDADAIASVGAQLLDALGYAHDAGVVHCDIKPENVLVEGRGADGAPRVRLADFGLGATRVPSHEESAMPVVAGTPGYVSPEQARGWGRLGPASDVYATGALLYRLVAGHAPHFGVTGTEVMRRTMSTEPLPLEPREGLAVSRAMIDAIERMMARAPAARPASAYRARRMLLAAAKEPRTVRSSIDGHADTMPPPPIAAGPSTDREASSGRPTYATPAVAISRYAGRRAALLGRDAEMATLESLCTRPDREGAHLVQIVGPNGMGRTRLLRELVSTMRARGAQIYLVTGRRGVRSPPFEVLGSLALDVAGAAGVRPAWVAAERLSAMLDAAGVPPDDLGRDALIAGLVGVGLPTAGGSVRHSAYRAFVALLAHASAEVARARAEGDGRAASTSPRPLALLCVDDADAIDEDSMAVLELLLRDVGEASAQIVLTATKGMTPVDRTTRIAGVTLTPLAHEPSVQILVALTDRVPSALDDAAREGRGVPAELTEIAAGVVSAGEGAYVERRLASLPPRTAAVLRAAAAWGGDAPIRSLAAMALEVDAELDEQTVSAAIDRLVLDEMLVRVPNPAAAIEPVVRFACERVRRRILATTDEATTRALHEAIVAFLVDESYDASLGVQAILAEHAESAGDLATAAHAHATAGRLGAAAARADASAHLAMALTLARSAEDAARAVDEPALLAELAALAIQRGEAETAVLFAEQGVAIVEDERRTLRGRLHRIVAEAHTQRRRFEPAMEALVRAVEALGDDGDPIELASAIAMEGWTLAYLDGRVEEGLALGERARDVASQIDAPEFRARLCGRLGGIYLRAGRWDDQLGTNLEDLGLSTSARDVGGVIRSHINIGVAYVNRGLTALARAHTEHALDLARRYGYRAAEYVALNNLALVAVDEQRFADAEQLALSSLHLAERNDIGGLGETRCTLARVALARGDTNAAEVQIEQMLAGADSEVDHEMATRLEAMLHCARGRPDLATELLRDHVETAAPDPYERACTELVFAAALRAMGLTADAARVDTAAADVLDRLGADPAHERRKWQSK